MFVLIFALFKRLMSKNNEGKCWDFANCKVITFTIKSNFCLIFGVFKAHTIVLPQFHMGWPLWNNVIYWRDISSSATTRVVAELERATLS